GKRGWGVVVPAGGELLRAGGADGMIGQDQAVGRDERTGAAGAEADGTFLEVFEPGVGGVELVLLLEELARRVVEQPHALVGAGGGRGHHRQRRGEPTHSQAYSPCRPVMPPVRRRAGRWAPFRRRSTPESCARRCRTGTPPAPRT